MLDYGETRVEFQYVNENSGPSDKIIGALMYYQNLRDDSDKHQTYFIIGDDDLVYNQDTVRSYRDEYVQDPNRVYTFFQNQERIPGMTHLQGSDTYVLPPSFFEKVSLNDYQHFLKTCFSECPDSFYQDDYLISYYLNKIVNLSINTVKNSLGYTINLNIDELHLDKNVRNRENNTISYLTTRKAIEIEEKTEQKSEEKIESKVEKKQKSKK
jgi:hypothetical protein